MPIKYLPLLGLGAVAALAVARTQNPLDMTEQRQSENPIGFEPVDPFFSIDYPYNVGADANLNAALAVVSTLESGNDFSSTTGGGHFSNYSDHPANTGEFLGVVGPLGLSTAAGGYQITRRTWNDIGGVAKYGDFSPEAQKAAAIDLFKRRGAYGDVLNGDILTARNKLLSEFIALADNSESTIVDLFTQNGGA